MKQSARGYTIIEVLVVLGVTGLLLVSASVALGGQSGTTGFQQSLRDIESKIKSTVQGINDSLFPNTTPYSCSSETGQPVLKREANSGIGTRKSCIYLGRALQVTKGSGGIKIYTVLGNRTKVNAAGETVPVTTFSEANPTPIIGSINLTENFLPATNGALLVKARYADSENSAQTVPTEMAGFYYDIEGTSATDPQLIIKAYQTESSTDAAVNACISESEGCNNFLVSSWLLCYQSANQSQEATLEVIAGATGVSTQLKFADCAE